MTSNRGIYCRFYATGIMVRSAKFHERADQSKLRRVRHHPLPPPAALIYAISRETLETEKERSASSNSSRSSEFAERGSFGSITLDLYFNQGQSSCVPIEESWPCYCDPQTATTAGGESRRTFPGGAAHSSDKNSGCA